MSETRFQSVADIIAIAIEREIEAAKGYGRMAAMARTPGLREFLEFLTFDEVTGVPMSDPTWLRCGKQRYMMALKRPQLSSTSPATTVRSCGSGSTTSP